MNGMIFAAGLGTRLRPLTNDRPKALVEVGNKPLLEHVIVKMRDAGIRKIVVNVHHYAGQIISFLEKHPEWKEEVFVSDESRCLLDTGGGLLKAREYFDPGESVLVHNVDIYSRIDLRKLMATHTSVKNYATLVVRRGEPGRGFRFDAEGSLKGWENSLTGEQKIVDETFYSSSPYSFCGVHIVSADFLSHISHQGVFSIIDEYLTQAKEHAVKMYFYDGPFIDLGTPESIAKAEKQSLFSF